MNSSIHLCDSIYARHIAIVNKQQRLLHFSKGRRSLQRAAEFPRASSLVCVRYSSFIARVQGKCSANGKPSLCIDPEGHRYPRQSRSWTRLYWRYNTTPLISLPVQSTRLPAVLHSRRERLPMPIRYSRGPGIIPRPPPPPPLSPVHPNDIKST